MEKIDQQTKLGLKDKSGGWTYFEIIQNMLKKGERKNVSVSAASVYSLTCFRNVHFFNPPRHYHVYVQISIVSFKIVVPGAWQLL